MRKAVAAGVVDHRLMPKAVAAGRPLRADKAVAAT